MKKGQYQEAISDCNTLLEIDQRNVGAYYTRGCAYEKLGEIDKGIEDFTVVLELDPNHVNAAFARGACQNRKVRIFSLNLNGPELGRFCESY